MISKFLKYENELEIGKNLSISFYTLSTRIHWYITTKAERIALWSTFMSLYSFEYFSFFGQ